MEKTQKVTSKMKTQILVCVCLVVFVESKLDISPKQIHLSYGVDPTRMVVTWSTLNDSKTTKAMIGSALSGLPPTEEVTGMSSRFEVPGNDIPHKIQYIHRVEFTGLKPGFPYKYKVGSKFEAVWSNTSVFKAMKDGSDWSPHIALYGDFGFENHQHSLQRIITDNHNGMYDAVFHVGDFAYDMDTNNGDIGDQFMNLIQPISTELPYMTCPGNHEINYNFTHYKKRFTMPGDEDGEHLFYSFNMGPARVISLSTEYYFAIQYGFIQLFRQYDWLEKELKEANKPENRAVRPWIITMGHRPMYCSNNNSDDCTKHHSVVKDGIPIIYKYGLEKLFYDNGVDVAIWAHEHSYERLWPVFDDEVRNGSLNEPYTNPGAPVHIITGSAGCKEDHDQFVPAPRPWSAFRSVDYGYTRMKIHNSTHLYMEQVSDEKNGTVIDKIMIIKDKHGSYK